MRNDKSLKNTSLYQEHLRLGARMGPFSGWNMPIQYSSIIKEHLHARNKAGIFDICHMGELVLKGKTADKDIDYLITCRTDNMPVGKCRYGFLLNNKGRIIDDLIAFRIYKNEFMLVINAGTVDKDKKWIKSHISPETNFEDISEEIAKLDLQGPLSKDVLASYTDVPLDEIKKYHFSAGKVCGVTTLISQTGYTGELGYELYFPKKEAVRLWKEFLKNKDVEPAGLGARNTLRLEMGYSLCGQDIDEEHTPLEAGLEKFIFMEKDFMGKEALIKQKSSGIKNVLIGFITMGRRSPRHNFDVVYNNEVVGKVTSATFSPCLKKAIGLCYIKTDFAKEGNKISLTDGKICIEAVIRNLPFIKTGSCK